ncbi:hypothetical protein QAD02_019517 [Eretmocerus hayati]|uniref:Uncharacterized protein n=1 Tax=Eretmocerus hayati TaxID=131215 RepID=A0ACC2PJG8_9HYME|nr:hypothetical protein QAD02_019517 [Eretmocerus hayati]
MMRVCKHFFLTTLGFRHNNDKAILRVLKLSSSQAVAPLPDNRGHHPCANRFDRSLIVDHIESFKPTVSHYRREHTPSARYLQSNLTIADMLENFLQVNPGVQLSTDLYGRCLKELNIRFTKLEHEECEKCETLQLHNPLHSSNSLDPDCDTCQAWQTHIRKAELAR